MLKTVICLAIAASIASAQTPRGEVTSVGNFIHIVSNLDKSIEFYRDIIGMDMPRPAAAFAETPEILKLYDGIGGKFRVGITQAAGSPMRMELEEWQGLERKPVKPKLSDPGASLLVVTVRQLDPVLARLKSAGMKPVSLRGEPVSMGPDMQAVTVADPDGFFVILEARRGAATAGAGESNITGLRFALVVTSLASMKAPFEALGLKPVVGGFADKDPYRPLLNTNEAIARMTVPMPGVDWALEFLEIRKGAKEGVGGRLPNPGAPVLRLAVKDANIALEALKTVGVTVASAGGEVITLPGGKAQLHAAILSLPNNLFVQVLQQ